MEVSAFRLTIIGGIVAIVLSAGMVGIFGGFDKAAPYLTMVGSIAIPALLALGRSEANAQKANTIENVTEARHVENLNSIESLRQENIASIESLREEIQKGNGK